MGGKVRGDKEGLNTSPSNKTVFIESDNQERKKKRKEMEEITI